ncbi:hypothetical protein GCM10027088_47440 [Nocardia goodfellowii]
MLGHLDACVDPPRAATLGQDHPLADRTLCALNWPDRTLVRHLGFGPLASLWACHRVLRRNSSPVVTEQSSSAAGR